MLNYLLAVFLSASFLMSAKAQSATDTLVYYVKNDGNIVSKIDSADYKLFVLPTSNSDDKKLYPVLGYYLDGTKKIITNSTTPLLPLKIEGAYLSYFPNGKRMVFANYKNGELFGDEIDYYPNGKIYAQKKHENNQVLLMECLDSLGKVLTTNGNGHWLVFNDNFTTVESEGNVLHGRRIGIWLQFKKTVFFDEGGYEYINTPGGKVYIEAEVMPQFVGGLQAFGRFLGKNLRYPIADRDSNIQGKVYVAFIVEKDGTLTNIRAVKSPSSTLAKEALRIMKLSSKWEPGNIKGEFVRVECTLPINFTLGK